jgi:hypothetical protein
MPIDFDAPEWRVRVMQDKAEILGLEVRLLAAMPPEVASRGPEVQFLQRGEPSWRARRSGWQPRAFGLEEAEGRLEEWLDYFNETGSRHPD